jgi:hypothetical protein
MLVAQLAGSELTSQTPTQICLSRTATDGAAGYNTRRHSDTLPSGEASGSYLQETLTCAVIARCAREARR